MHTQTSPIKNEKNVQCRLGQPRCDISNPRKTSTIFSSSRTPSASASLMEVVVVKLFCVRGMTPTGCGWFGLSLASFSRQAATISDIITFLRFFMGHWRFFFPEGASTCPKLGCPDEFVVEAVSLFFLNKPRKQKFFVLRKG